MTEITVVISNFIKINVCDLPTEVFSEIMNNCTYDNPEFIQQLIRKKKVIGLPRYLRTCKVENELLLIPRGKIMFLKEVFSKHGIRMKVQDYRVTNFFQKEIRFREGMSLFPYQEKAKNEIVSYTQRLLSADCGAGKTVIGCGIIDSLQQWTLIAVDTTELLEQWQQEITKFLDLDFEVGVIGAGVYKIAPITVALVQSLHTLTDGDWRDLNDKFGCFIYDEVQGLPAPTRFEIITRFAGKYLYGLSATISRSDGLEFFTFDSISPAIVEVDVEELKAANRFLDADLLFVKSFTIHNTPREFKNLVWNKLIDRMINDPKRNQLIIDDIAEMIKIGHKCIVLSSRVEHCNTIVTGLKSLGIKAEMFTGDVNKDDRQEIKGDFEDSDLACIVATYQIAQKGLNIPTLSCLHLPLPIKDRNILQQATGRVRRVRDGKLKPMIRDYVDMSAPILKKKAKNRAAIYKDLGYIQIQNEQDLYPPSGGRTKILNRV